MNRLKSLEITWICFKYNIFMSLWIYKDGEIPSYKNESIERRYLNNVRKNQILKVKSSLLELKIDFIELKDRELKDSKN